MEGYLIIHITMTIFMTAGDYGFTGFHFCKYDIHITACSLILFCHQSTSVVSNISMPTYCHTLILSLIAALNHRHTLLVLCLFLRKLMAFTKLSEQSFPVLVFSLQ